MKVIVFCMKMNEKADLNDCNVYKVFGKWQSGVMKYNSEGNVINVL